MLFQAIVIAASAAIASAQVTYNATTGQYICPADKPNGDFCAGDSLSTNIILRCTNGVAQPGNCNDNLAGYPPLGVGFSQCWQTSTTSGDAACAKNCVVQCSSGGCGNGTITLPNCTPIVSSSSTVSSSTTTTTGTTTVVTKGTTVTSTYTSTSTYCPSTTLTTSKATGTGSPAPPTNGTVSGNPTKTPVGPTTSGPTPPTFTGAANTFHPAIGGTVAAMGLIVAYFL